MSRYDYFMSREISLKDYPFHALIMAAMRQADNDNTQALQLAFPHVWRELQARYDARGGYLPGEK